ncbi:MAG TPA: nitroreductase [Paracoccus solventivorans]|uniref:nitroreductase n=1 Tax=Paracoccus solventivorans TaxID=53463 RepID=UPI002BFC1570|nr:nitroreductase [Paracoccus solventivorans]HMM09126.1 nitroreductase [Paracoccus solventivorans]
MSIDEAVARRRSVRGYLPDEVPQDRLRELLALAQLAPSNCNIQPWITHVLSGPSLRSLGDKMVAAAEAGIPPDPDFSADRKFEGVYRARQIDAAVQLYGAMGIDRHDRPRRDWAYRRNLDFFGAPHAALIFLHHTFEEREAVDLGIYAQTLMLLLTSRGISSCAQGALGLYPGIIRDHLGLPQTHRLIFGISFGYEDPAVEANRARVGRAGLEDAVVFHSDAARA